MSEPNDVRTIIAVSGDKIIIDEVLAGLISPTCGALVVFTGMVRGITTRGEVHKTRAIEYEAYQAMAEEKIQQVVKEIRQKWPMIEGIAIIQRIGTLPQGTITTLIACTAAHRDMGIFDGAKYGIDRLKEIVPIWKKEIEADGVERWVIGEYHPRPGD